MTASTSPIPHPLGLLWPDAPDWVRDGLAWVVGAEWPEGDERAIWDLAEEWYGVAARLATPADSAAAAAAGFQGSYEGPVADAFGAAWAAVATGDHAALDQLLTATDEVGRMVEECGRDIEAAKIEIWIEVTLLVIELISLIVAVALTLGAATPAAAAALTVSRLAVQRIFATLVTAMTAKGITSTPSPLRHGLRDGISEVAEVAPAGTVQAHPAGAGHRDTLDTDPPRTAGTAASAIPGTTHLPGGLARGAAGDALGETAASRTTGGGRSLTDLAMTATSGARGAAADGLHTHLINPQDDITGTAANSFTIDAVLSPEPAQSGGTPGTGTPALGPDPTAVATGAIADALHPVTDPVVDPVADPVADVAPGWPAAAGGDARGSFAGVLPAVVPSGDEAAPGSRLAAVADDAPGEPAPANRDRPEDTAPTLAGAESPVTTAVSGTAVSGDLASAGMPAAAPPPGSSSSVPSAAPVASSAGAASAIGRPGNPAGPLAAGSGIGPDVAGDVAAASKAVADWTDGPARPPAPPVDNGPVQAPAGPLAAGTGAGDAAGSRAATGGIGTADRSPVAGGLGRALDATGEAALSRTVDGGARDTGRGTGPGMGDIVERSAPPSGPLTGGVGGGGIDAAVPGQVGTWASGPPGPGSGADRPATSPGPLAGGIGAGPAPVAGADTSPSGAVRGVGIGAGPALAASADTPSSGTVGRVTGDPSGLAADSGDDAQPGPALAGTGESALPGSAPDAAPGVFVAPPAGGVGGVSRGASRGGGRPAAPAFRPAKNPVVQPGVPSPGLLDPASFGIEEPVPGSRPASASAPAATGGKAVPAAGSSPDGAAQATAPSGSAQPPTAPSGGVQPPTVPSGTAQPPTRPGGIVHAAVVVVPGGDVPEHVPGLLGSRGFGMPTSDVAAAGPVKARSADATGEQASDVPGRPVVNAEEPDAPHHLAQHQQAADAVSEVVTEARDNPAGT